MGSTSDYATRSGATAEVAEETGQVLRANGNDVEARDVRQIKALSGYSAIVLGSLARIGKLMPEVLRFAERSASILRELPAIRFSQGVIMNQDSPENRRQAEAFYTAAG
ncbi:MAG: hypothetical protein LLG44_06795 [Chloroflexi bacterium]|nr:hypothetical protein [Chloroflexota bacterium]